LDRVRRKRSLSFRRVDGIAGGNLLCAIDKIGSINFNTTGDDMHYRELGRTGWNLSTISFGAWAIGGTWGNVKDEESLAALHRALDLGVNFFDTADVYGDGRSEQLLTKLRKERSEPFYIATKAGRRADPHIAAGYTRQNLTAYVERSLRNLDMEALDLVQLHSPPTEVYYMPDVFDILDSLVKDGKLLH